MTARYGKQGRKAKIANDGVVIASGRVRPTISSAMRLAKTLWPEKTAFFLAAYAGVDPRRAADWLLGKSEPSAQALQTMLRGEHGFEFLAALMAEARPKWWRRFRRQVEISEVRAEHETTRRRLEALERGEE